MMWDGATRSHSYVVFKGKEDCAIERHEGQIYVVLEGSELWLREDIGRHYSQFWRPREVWFFVHYGV